MLTNTILATLFATAALAAPTTSVDNSKRENVSLQAAIPDWTFEDLTRTCNSGNTECKWTFGINANDGSDVPKCKYNVKGSPASETPGTVPQKCGAYTITSGWSPGTGEGTGFTTVSVVNQDTGKIAYGGYDDKDLKNGKAVDPDRSWVVYDLP